MLCIQSYNTSTFLSTITSRPFQQNVPHLHFMFLKLLSIFQWFLKLQSDFLLSDRFDLIWIRLTIYTYTYSLTVTVIMIQSLPTIKWQTNVWQTTTFMNLNTNYFESIWCMCIFTQQTACIQPINSYTDFLQLKVQHCRPINHFTLRHHTHYSGFRWMYCHSINRSIRRYSFTRG